MLFIRGRTERLITTCRFKRRSTDDLIAAKVVAICFLEDTNARTVFSASDAGQPMTGQCFGSRIPYRPEWICM